MTTAFTLDTASLNAALERQYLARVASHETFVARAVARMVLCDGRESRPADLAAIAGERSALLTCRHCGSSTHVPAMMRGAWANLHAACESVARRNQNRNR